MHPDIPSAQVTDLPDPLPEGLAVLDVLKALVVEFGVIGLAVGTPARRARERRRADRAGRDAGCRRQAAFLAGIALPGRRTVDYARQCLTDLPTSGNAVLERTCLRAKLERIFSMPGMGVSCSRMKRSSAAMSVTTTRIR